MRTRDTDPGHNMTSRPEALPPERLESEERAMEPDPDEQAFRASAATWQEIKGRFVDDPEGAIAVAEEMVRVAVEEKIRALRQGLEDLRLSGPSEGASRTEDLRTQLIRYQAYFEHVSGTTAH